MSDHTSVTVEQVCDRGGVEGPDEQLERLLGGAGQGLTLAERSARSGIGAAARRAKVQGRHCWVIDPPGLPGRWPGLLLEWRAQRDGGWRGLVVYSALIGDQPVVVQSWLDASMLESFRT